MERTDFGTIVVGVLGVALIAISATPGTYVVGYGPLKFDPMFAGLAGFGFLVVWGLLSAVGWDRIILGVLTRSN